MLIPGVSGGTVAVYLGIYNKIISSVAEIRENIKKKYIFFVIVIDWSGIKCYNVVKTF